MQRVFIFVVTIQATLVQTVFSQCVNRVVPNCAPNLLPYETYLPLEAILSNQMFIEAGIPLLPAPNCAAPYLPSLAASYQIAPSLAVPEPVVYAPTVVQDNVAINLANALQLLVVSNLLSSTLPGTCNPGCVEPYPVGPYNYIY